VAILELILIVLLGITSGLMIGCVGIGGVILVPALVFLAGVPIQISIPAAMMAYILSGFVATAVFARNKSIRWGTAAWLSAGATPTAFAGAWAECRQPSVAGSLSWASDIFFGAECAENSNRDRHA